MKKILLALIVAVSALSMMALNVEAKRLGGGGSIGRQSSGSITRQAPAQSSQQQYAAPAPSPMPAAPAPAPSPWRGMLGGALMGLGMGALLSHFGMLGGAIGGIVMIVLLVLVLMLIVRLFRSRGDDNGPPVYDDGFTIAPGASTSIGSRIEPTVQSPSLKQVPLASGTAAEKWSVPADFDVPAFLRNAKTYFIRLQASWDKADIKDLREFTTPEMFAELKLQLQERGSAPNVTDVVTLGAELLDVEIAEGDYQASVKFSGMIKESETAEAAPFEEVWNLSKPVSGQGGWVLAGIQQLV